MHEASLGLKKVFLLTLFLIVSYFAYSLFYYGKVLPNVYFGNLNLGGKSSEQVESLVSKSVENYQSQILVFNLDGQTSRISVADLGISFDSTKIAGDAVSFGRSGRAGEDLLWRFSAPFKRHQIAPSYHVDFAKLEASTNKNFSGYESEAVNARIVIDESKPRIADEIIGKLIDKSKLEADLRSHIDNLSGGEIKVVLASDVPLIKKDQVQKAFERVKSLDNSQILLVWGNDSWNLSGQSLLDILKFSPAGYSGDYLAGINLNAPVLVLNIDWNDNSPPLLDVGLSDNKINDFVSGIASAVDRSTVDATLKFENGKVTQFTPAQDGQRVNRDLVKQIILDRVSLNGSTNSQTSINLPVYVEHAKIANEQINSLGIKELIGKGVSYFAGSIANRIYNVGLGASRINGTLVKPGEVFSFNNSVGEVSGATGYRQAYVISSGRTVLDDGGGICQVSTTVFRSALNAGLPIVARTAHAYRVGYYEQRGFGPGLDATVWSPAVDMQFKNDTNAHILVQSIMDPDNARLEVDLYGTSDGRTVEVSAPVLTNQTPALPDKYQDDHTLPKGTVKQVDFPAPGASVVFGRKVFRGAQKIIDESFRSNYAPWQAIFLVGTAG